MNKGDKTRDYKLKNYIITVTTNISALLSGKIDKCKYRLDEEILLPKQHGKCIVKKQVKTIDNKEKKNEKGEKGRAGKRENRKENSQLCLMMISKNMIMTLLLFLIVIM